MYSTQTLKQTHDRVIAVEQGFFVERARPALPGHLEYCLELLSDLLVCFNTDQIALRSSGLDVVSFKIRSGTSNCSQDQDGVEVDIRQSLGVRSDSVDEAFKIRRLADSERCRQFAAYVSMFQR